MYVFLADFAPGDHFNFRKLGVYGLVGGLTDCQYGCATCQEMPLASYLYQQPYRNKGIFLYLYCEVNTKIMRQCVSRLSSKILTHIHYNEL